MHFYSTFFEVHNDDKDRLKDDQPVPRLTDPTTDCSLSLSPQVEILCDANRPRLSVIHHNDAFTAPLHLK